MLRQQPPRRCKRKSTGQTLVPAKHSKYAWWSIRALLHVLVPIPDLQNVILSYDVELHRQQWLEAWRITCERLGRYCMFQVPATWIYGYMYRWILNVTQTLDPFKESYDTWLASTFTLQVGTDDQQPWVSLVDHVGVAHQVREYMKTLGFLHADGWYQSLRQTNILLWKKHWADVHVVMTFRIDHPKVVNLYQKTHVDLFDAHVLSYANVEPWPGTGCAWKIQLHIQFRPLK